MLAYVGLGSNLQEPADQVSRALAELTLLPDTFLMAHSRLYRSAPLGPADQPDYINAVAALRTGLAAPQLLQQLLIIENRHGRMRALPDRLRWGPRTLDLDLLLYGDMQSADAALTLPHPGLHLRGFVLYPLCEIAPDCVVPGLGRVRELLERCTDAAPTAL